MELQVHCSKVKQITWIWDDEKWQTLENNRQWWMVKYAKCQTMGNNR